MSIRAILRRALYSWRDSTRPTIASACGRSRALPERSPQPGPSMRAKQKGARGGNMVSPTLETPRPEDADQQPEPEQPRECEADQRDHVQAEHVRPALGQDADQARPDQAPGDDQCDDEPVEGDV